VIVSDSEKPDDSDAREGQLSAKVADLSAGLVVGLPESLDLHWFFFGPELFVPFGREATFLLLRGFGRIFFGPELFVL
jgi:hypothetical protein